MRGVVLDEAGNVVAGVSVAAVPAKQRPPDAATDVLYMASNPAEFVAKDETDGAGRFELPGISPGMWEVGVVIIDFPPDLEVTSTGTLVEVPSGVQEVEVRVPVFRSLSIRGTALSPAGEPAEGAVLFSTSLDGEGFADARADAEGHFTLGPLAPGLHKVSAWLPESLTYFTPLEVEAGASGLALQARAAGGLQGRVLQADGETCERVLVRLTAPGTLDALPIRSPEGHFELSPLPPGTDDLIISSPSGDALALTRQVEAGKLTELPDLHLEAAGSLLVQVGERASMARATLRRGAAVYPLDLWPGQTLSLSLPPGPYSLELPPPGARTIEFEIAVGAELSIDARIE